jgi:hypothetical protein
MCRCGDDRHHACSCDYSYINMDEYHTVVSKVIAANDCELIMRHICVSVGASGSIMLADAVICHSAYHKLLTLDALMEGASCGGHILLVKYLMSLGASGFTRSLIAATNGGSIPVVKLLLPKPHEVNPLDLLSIAASAGHLDLVMLFIQCGAARQLTLTGGAAGSYQDSIYDAISYGHDNIVEYIISVVDERGDILDSSRIILLASANGRVNVIRHIASRVSRSDLILHALCGTLLTTDNTDVMEMLGDLGVTSEEYDIAIASELYSKLSGSSSVVA